MPYTRAKYKAEDVAEFIIYLASREMEGDAREKPEGISHLKLQKVLYFAQAYYLAKLNRALFSDKIEAWGLGPVVPSVYHKYKDKGRRSGPITIKKDTSKLSNEDKEIIAREIWSSFGGFSARRLVDITHAHTPWKKAFEAPDKTISRQAIQDYYKSLFR